MARILALFGTRAVFPEAARGWLGRRLRELGGVVVLTAAGFLLVALITFSAGDPSWNHATDAPVRNLLGRPGAVLSDLLLQLGGIAVVAPVLTLAFWGRVLIGGRSIGWMRPRVAAVVLATAMLSVAAEGMPVPQGWPLATGLGGLSGTLLLGWLGDLGAATGETLGGGPLTMICGAIGVLLWMLALGISWADCRALARSLANGWSACVAAFAASAAALCRVQSWTARRPPVLRRVDPPLTETIEAREANADAAAGLVAPSTPPMRAGRKAEGSRQPQFEFESRYCAPTIDLLRAPPQATGAAAHNPDSLEQNACLLLQVLEDFGVHGEIVKVRPGPVVTLYELEPAAGTKTSRVIGLADDIARSMSAVSVRVAVVPGRNVIGIELPNLRRETVYLRELIGSQAFERSGGQLTLALGKDIGGGPVFVDLARMPHLLIAGTTGSGKSVAINTMILSLLYQLPPDACKLVLIDPKMLELSVYDGIPHLLAPVVTEPGKAVVALKWAVREMEDRYRMMSQLGVRNISGFNARITEARGKGETLVRRVQTGFDETAQPVIEEQVLDLQPLPFIVIVVDEMADLMLVAGKDIEAAVQRLSQMARAAGIHLIMATQRPSVDVITGTIKANFPTRISFHVTSKIDSRTILGEQGAEQLLGQGDMLYMATGGRIVRVHGPFVSDEEVERIVSSLRSQGEPAYVTEFVEEADDGAEWRDDDLTGVGEDAGDDLYAEAVALVAREGKASTSYVQRRLQIGYNRAARLVERMEAEGLVTKPDRVGRREVLIGERSSVDR
jgi:S-DNA-T family DNA segregation ATPase FtsK/SpoIIIE